MDQIMKRRLGASLAVLALTAGGLGVAGCGGDSAPAASTATAATSTTAAADNGVGSLTATEILTKAAAAASNADSVTMKGDITTDGTTVGLNLALARNAADGTITIKGADVQLRLVDGTIYMKGPKEFWSALGSQGSAVSALVADKWFSFPADSKDDNSGLSSLGMFANMDGLFSSLLDTKKSVTVKGTSQVNGQPVVLLAGGKTGTLAVATTGEPYPVQVVGDGSDGTIDFINWNGPVNAVKPANVVDLAALVRDSGSGSSTSGSSN